MTLDVEKYLPYLDETPAPAPNGVKPVTSLTSTTSESETMR